MTLLAFDAGWRTNSEAEHSARTTAQVLGLRVVLALTHFARDPARVVVTLEVEEAPDPAQLDAYGLADAAAPGIADLLDAHRSRASGRAFVFPGSADLVGSLPVGDVVGRSAISRIRLIGGALDSGATLDTQQFVRPVYEAGELVLVTRPAAGGCLVPFERPEQRPCCAEHG